MEFSRIPEVVADLPVSSWIEATIFLRGCRAGPIRMGSRNLYDSIAILASLKRL